MDWNIGTNLENIGLIEQITRMIKLNKQNIYVNITFL